MTSTAAKATSQALTLAKPAAAPPAAKADRAQPAQDRSAEFAEVLADKSRGATEEDHAAKVEPTPRPEAEVTSTKPRETDRAPAQGEPPVSRSNDCAEAGADAAAKPVDTKPDDAAPVPTTVVRPKPEDEQDEPVSTFGVEVAAATVAPRQPSAPQLKTDDGHDADAEPLEGAVFKQLPRDDSKLSSDESGDEVVAKQSDALAAPNDVKRPLPVSARAVSHSMGPAQKTSPDRVPAGFHVRAAAGEDAAPAARTGVADRPLTIGELNELLVRIDPQWAAKGLALPTNVGAVASVTRTSDAPLWSEESPLATYPSAPTQSAPSAQTHFAGAETSNTAPESPALVNPNSSERLRADEQAPKSDRSAPAADSAKPAAAAADRSFAGSTSAATSVSAQPMDRAGERTAPVAPAHGRGVLSIDAARPNARPAAANPTTSATPQSPDFAAQVQRGMAAAIAQGGGQVTLRLNPQALGQLRVKLDLRADVVKLRFEVGSSAARSLLDEQLPGLGRMLEAQGLRVAHSSVGTDSSLAPSHNSSPPQDANGTGTQQFADGGGQWAGQGADSGAQRQASENAAGRIESAEAGESPRSGEIHIEREGGVLDPVTLRLNAIA
ncbi:MAG: flagellar hook-length control protein FliK [Phycisphaerales bacterium]